MIVTSKQQIQRNHAMREHTWKSMKLYQMAMEQCENAPAVIGLKVLELTDLVLVFTWEQVLCIYEKGAQGKHGYHCRNVLYIATSEQFCAPNLHGVKDALDGCYDRLEGALAGTVNRYRFSWSENGRLYTAVFEGPTRFHAIGDWWNLHYPAHNSANWHKHAGLFKGQLSDGHTTVTVKILQEG